MNKQKWLTDKLDRAAWLDKDAIIEVVMFECLRHFVEDEKGLSNPADFAEEFKAGLISEKELSCMQEKYDDLSAAYEHITSKCNLFQEMEGRDEALAKIWKHYKTLWT